jgi:hypothetical protein
MFVDLFLLQTHIHNYKHSYIHRSIVDQAQQLANVTKILLSNISGVSKKNADLGKQLKEEGMFVVLCVFFVRKNSK